MLFNISSIELFLKPGIVYIPVDPVDIFLQKNCITAFVFSIKHSKTQLIASFIDVLDV